VAQENAKMTAARRNRALVKFFMVTFLDDKIRKIISKKDGSDEIRD